MTYETILYDLSQKPVARIALNRPDKRNPVGPLTCGELVHAFRQAKEDRQVRCVVLTGVGKVFSAGGDLSQMAAAAAASASANPAAQPASLSELFTTMHTTHKPIIAMVNGHALAGGLGLMVACDLVVASAHAEFGLPEVDRGLWPMMVTAELVRAIGRKKALELMLTGRRVTADEAERLGLINRVVAPERLEEETLALAQALAVKSPSALRLGLAAFYATQDLALRPALEHLEAELSVVLSTHDAAEGLRAFLEKRPPKWSDA